MLESNVGNLVMDDHGRVIKDTDEFDFREVSPGLYLDYSDADNYAQEFQDDWEVIGG